MNLEGSIFGIIKIYIFWVPHKQITTTWAFFMVNNLAKIIDL
jgi:hypothetical protein